MRIDRLLSILTLLLQTDRITAPELAQRLEVSRRTITRDIDALCRAGIPIATRQGGGGGISIVPGYKLDKSLLTREDLENILIGLHSLETVSDSSLQPLLQKLAPREREEAVVLPDSVVIDLASHYRESLSGKITLLRRAVRERRLVEFDYYSPGGQSRRQVEPGYVVFQWSDWYLLGFCRHRGDFRLFKLGRLWNLTKLEEPFTPREIPPEKRDLGAHLTDHIPMEILFSPQALHRVVEAYGPDCYTLRGDGLLHFRGRYTNRDYTVSWILGFGSQAEVLSPPDLRRETEEEIARMGKRYGPGSKNRPARGRPAK